MKWMKERDLLIAQTMAFVQSVTGKPPEAGKKPPEAVKAVAGSVASGPIALRSVETVESTAASAPPSDVTPPRTPPAARAPTVTEARPAEARAVEARTEPPWKAPSLPPLSFPDLREDFQSEIRARVANFRAHQERFTREREAYCAATMAKVHATLNKGEVPPPRAGK